jgi:DNA (cytosine-5)-methyltransferase 1
MSVKPRLLDTFCCAGGSSKGYSDAGFEVVGMDWKSQPRFPFEFILGAAEECDVDFFRQFDALHASPPCQRHTLAQRIQQREHPDWIEVMREKFKAARRPYVIENVVGAPLQNPVMLCGAMFPPLRVYRHRLFEVNFPLVSPRHPEHAVPLRKMGRRPRQGDFMHVVGNFSGVSEAREAMGCPWMTRDELREAIPPAYTEFVGYQLMSYMEAQR